MNGLCECGCGEPTRIATYTCKRDGYVKGQPIRFVYGHRLKQPQYEVRDCGYATPCWVWLLSTSTEGYGQFVVAGRHRNAHRVYYEQHVGPVPDGLVVDHLCRNRLCVNPDHLEPVTQAENVRRGAKGRLITHCVNGHEYTPENTWMRKEGRRQCRACHRERQRRRRAATST